MNGDRRALYQVERDRLPIFMATKRVAALVPEELWHTSTELAELPQTRADNDGGSPATAQIRRQGTAADRWTYGEIRQWAIRSLTDFSAPAGLADAKASIAAVCARGNRCASVDGARAVAPGDRAAWDNIVNANGGTDRSGGGNFMCVGTENCWFVHSCYRCSGGARRLMRRDRPLQSTGRVIVNGHTLYFYNDPLLGWCSRDDYRSGCS